MNCCFDELLLWWIAALMTCCFDELLLWWIDTLMNCHFNKLPIWWIAALMNCHFDELPLWWIATSMNCRFNKLPIWWIAASMNCRFMNCHFNELPIWWIVIALFHWLYNWPTLCCPILRVPIMPKLMQKGRKERRFWSFGRRKQRLTIFPFQIFYFGISNCDIGLGRNVSVFYEMKWYKIKIEFEIWSLTSQFFDCKVSLKVFEQNLAQLLVIFNARKGTKCSQRLYSAQKALRTNYRSN